MLLLEQNSTTIVRITTTRPRRPYPFGSQALATTVGYSECDIFESTSRKTRKKGDVRR